MDTPDASINAAGCHWIALLAIVLLCCNHIQMISIYYCWCNFRQKCMMIHYISLPAPQWCPLTKILVIRMSGFNQKGNDTAYCCVLLSISPSQRADWHLQSAICHSLMTSLESPPISHLSIIASCSYAPSTAVCLILLWQHIFFLPLPVFVIAWFFCLVAEERKRDWVDTPYWWLSIGCRDAVARKKNRLIVNLEGGA